MVKPHAFDDGGDVIARNDRCFERALTAHRVSSQQKRREDATVAEPMIAI
jgi:hypothetical protein